VGVGDIAVCTVVPHCPSGYLFTGELRGVLCNEESKYDEMGNAPRHPRQKIHMSSINVFFSINTN
jgi:hypothetical protein